jgi:ribosome biogenesis GTPase
VVGDWVAFTDSSSAGPLVVEAVLERRNHLSRKASGARAEEQVVAANVDLVLVVMGLDGDFNPRRLERFLTLAEASRVEAAVVLNKSDLCADRDAKLAAVRSVTAVPIVVVSALEGDLSSVELLLAARWTAVLVGSSGAGKSTLINRLLGGSALSTAAVREHDSRGRHTTTHRELFRLPGGGLVIDNPGVREVQLWSERGAALDAVFDDIESLAARCRFSDCTHREEPGCAVRAAIDAGELDAARLENLRKLELETEALERRKDERARREHDRRLGKLYRSVQRAKRTRWD